MVFVFNFEAGFMVKVLSVLVLIICEWSWNAVTWSYLRLYEWILLFVVDNEVNAQIWSPCDGWLFCITSEEC